MKLNNTKFIELLIGTSDVFIDTSHKISQVLEYYIGSDRGPAPFGGRDQEIKELNGWLDDTAGIRNKAIVSTAGERKSLLSDGKDRWFGSTPNIDEKNPIGAGDAMVAGLVWRLDKGDSLRNAFPWGIACGAAAASQPGTGMASQSQIEHLIQEIKVEKV